MTYSVVDRMTDAGIRSFVVKGGTVVAGYQHRYQAERVAALKNGGR